MNKTLLACAVAIVAVASPAFSADVLKIYILSVGQNDAQLIIGPSKTMLIDVGGPSAQAAYISENVHDITGESSVDYLLISHFHTDHIGNRRDNGQAKQGLWWLLEHNFTIGTIIDRGDKSPFGVHTSPHEHYVADIDGWISSGKIGNRITPIVGQSFDLGGGINATVIALNGNGVLEQINADDPDRFADYPPSENDYSIAVKITVGNFEYFTAGDLTGVNDKREYPNGKQESYNDIETSVAPLVGDVELQRVNHHGSGHSSNPLFEGLLDPEVSIISCGRNGYGHPSVEAFTRAEGTSRVYITTDVSNNEWPNRATINDNIVGGNIEILVAEGGATYKVQGDTFQSFSDADESANVDALNSFPFSISGTIATTRTITPSDAPGFIGQSVTVEGKVLTVRRGAGSEPSYLNFFKPYWQGISARIDSANRSQFGNISNKYLDKTVQITGTVIDVDGRPMIDLTATNQIKVNN